VLQHATAQPLIRLPSSMSDAVTENNAQEVEDLIVNFGDSIRALLVLDPEQMHWEDADPEGEETHIVKHGNDSLRIVFHEPDPGDMYGDGAYGGGWCIYENDGSQTFPSQSIERGLATLAEAKQAAHIMMEGNK